VSIRLTTYVGPMIKIAITDDFDAKKFCYETIDEQFHIGEWIRKPSKYWFLLPNIPRFTRHSYEFGEDLTDDECDDPLLNPDIPSILKEFSHDAGEILHLIPVPYEVVWGVYTYWS
jgi:hypothetical protein